MAFLVLAGPWIAIAMVFAWIWLKSKQLQEHKTATHLAMEEPVIAWLELERSKFHEQWLKHQRKDKAD